MGLNLLFLWPEAGGIGRYAVELLKALRGVDEVSGLVAFLGRDAPRDLCTQAAASGIELVRLPVGASGRTRLVAEMLVLPVLARQYRLDVLHSPANISPLVTPGVTNIVTLHDLIWLRYAESWGTRRAALTTRSLVTASVRTVARIITDSRASKDDIVELMHVPSEKVDVVPLGVSDNRVTGTPEPELRLRLGLENRRVALCVAQLRPYKNLARLISAFASLRRDDLALVVAGVPSGHRSELTELVEHEGVANRVIFPGWVPEADLETLHRIAAVFVLPSLIEGFGLPVLEAMRHGVPVTCSNRPALPEIAAGAALLFDPTDEAEMRDSIERLLTDQALATQLSEQGRRRARQYTWERTARETVASYRRALPTPRGAVAFPDRRAT